MLERGVRLAALTALVVVLFAPQLSRSAEAAGVGYFDPTSHTLGGPIREYWESHGGLWLFGYPVSEPYAALSEDGRPIVAQYFERTRLEYHPALDDTPYRVLGGRLGAVLTAGREHQPEFLPVAGAGAGCEYFAPTGHTLCAPFRDWWRDKGGLPIFGYPLSEAFEEGGYTVQYFERARFEWHPENLGTGWEVELGHLGIDDARRTGASTLDAFNAATPVMTTLRVATDLTASPGGEVVGTLNAGTPVRVIDGPRSDRYLVQTPGITGWVAFSTLSWTARPDPRTTRVEPLAAFDPRLAGTVRLVDAWLSVGIYDPASGRLYGDGDGGLIGSASLSKSLLLVVALRQIEAGRFSLDDVRGLIEPMIIYSDNDAPNVLWQMVGGDEGVEETLREAGIDGFTIRVPWDWGQIAATGADWARFYALLGSGQLLSPDHTALALGLMENVTGEHRWGVSTPGADRLGIGKNGWYPDDDPYDWRIASAGFVGAREGAPGVAPLIVVVVAQYPGELGEEWGIATASELTQMAVDHARLRWADHFFDRDRALSSVSRPPLPIRFQTIGFRSMY
ncbi:MAG: serine hydrolase [Thermomicrobiales bacterium]